MLFKRLSCLNIRNSKDENVCKFIADNAVWNTSLKFYLTYFYTWILRLQLFYVIQSHVLTILTKYTEYKTAHTHARTHTHTCSRARVLNFKNSKTAIPVVLGQSINSKRQRAPLQNVHIDLWWHNSFCCLKTYSCVYDYTESERQPCLTSYLPLSSATAT